MTPNEHYLDARTPEERAEDHKTLKEAEVVNPSLDFEPEKWHPTMNPNEEKINNGADGSYDPNKPTLVSASLPSYSCRFHPTDEFHEVGCPHRAWMKEELQDALNGAKRSNKLLVREMNTVGSQQYEKGKQDGREEAGSYTDSYHGKLWSTAVQKAFEAPFPEVAIQHLLSLVHLKSRIETLDELLHRKWEAHIEREAISPMGIVSVAQSEPLPVPSGATVRQLQYVKVWDIEQMLKEAKDLLTHNE